jgi:thiamine-monophosphate kinase
LPAVDERWLDAFATGLFDCASRFDIELVGGDTTRGPLNLCVTVFGGVDATDALRRDRAQPGDEIWVSGMLGRAALGLEQVLARRTDGSTTVEPALLAALDRPTPRLSLGRALAGVAHAAIDVSDGLLQDLDHVATASRVGVRVDCAAIPVGDALGMLPAAHRARLALAGGDDYELCFTAPVAARAAVVDAGARTDTPVTRIGRIVAAADERTYDGWPFGADAPRGFDHFA